MDKTIRRVIDPVAQQQESYDYWRGTSVAERMNAVAEIVQNVYALKGIDLDRMVRVRKMVRLKYPNWKAASQAR